MSPSFFAVVCPAKLDHTYREISVEIEFLDIGMYKNEPDVQRKGKEWIFSEFLIVKMSNLIILLDEIRKNHLILNRFGHQIRGWFF